MTKSQFRKLFVPAGRILLVYVLVFSQTAWGAQKAKDKPDSPQKSTAQQTNETKASPAVSVKARKEQAQDEESEIPAVSEKSSGDRSHQGIKVHGHWTIDVHDPNGSLVSRREFENGLATPKALTWVLGRKNSVGPWMIALTPSGNNCGNAFTSCAIAEPNAGISPSPSTSTNLLVTIANDSSTLTLSGNITAPVSLQIVGPVSTSVGLCAASTSATTCSAGGWTFQDFTGTALGVPIAVQAGQIIQVTVVISFS